MIACVLTDLASYLASILKMDHLVFELYNKIYAHYSTLILAQLNALEGKGHLENFQDVGPPTDQVCQVL